jgi:hypothetical protein
VRPYIPENILLLVGCFNENEGKVRMAGIFYWQAT